jgi:O-acetylhomoserine (thiol)-lyase
MNDEELIAAGVPGDLVRLSCGLENYQDLIDDIEQALSTL